MMGVGVNEVPAGETASLISSRQVLLYVRLTSSEFGCKVFASRNLGLFSV
jgi:hypothetical protein